MQTFKRVVVSVQALAAAGTFPFEHAEALPLARGAGDAAVVRRVKPAPYPFKCWHHCDNHLRSGYGWRGRSAPAVPHSKLATAPVLSSLGKRLAACPSLPRHPVIFAPHQPIIPAPPHPSGVDPASPARVIPIGGSGNREGR